jgi:hypothetical protein
VSYVPASRAAWSRSDDYSGPRAGPSERIISVTNLINAPRIVRLASLYRAELPGDIPGEDTWRLLGTAVHGALERAAPSADPPPLLIEHRAATEVGGWTLSGQIDVLEADGTLVDYKVTSAWSVSDGRQGKGEWASQLNVLKWLLERTGTVPRGTIRSLAVWVICRDWSATQAGRDDGYPQSQEIAVPLPIWGDDETYRYVTERIALHEAARTNLPECTPAERWARGGGFAVMKSVKSPRAERVFDRREDAERYLAEAMNGKGFIEARPGISVRCQRYCRCFSVCDQGKALAK